MKLYRQGRLTALTSDDWLYLFQQPKKDLFGTPPFSTYPPRVFNTEECRWYVERYDYWIARLEEKRQYFQNVIDDGEKGTRIALKWRMRIDVELSNLNLGRWEYSSNGGVCA